MNEFIKKDEKKLIKHLFFQNIVYKNLQFQFKNFYY